VRKRWRLSGKKKNDFASFQGKLHIQRHENEENLTRKKSWTGKKGPIPRRGKGKKAGKKKGLVKEKTRKSRKESVSWGGGEGDAENIYVLQGTNSEKGKYDHRNSNVLGKKKTKKRE